MLHLVGVENRDRVTVGNLDYGVFEDAGCALERCSENEEEQECEEQGKAGSRAIHVRSPMLLGTL